jgi:hypothetical protein
VNARTFAIAAIVVAALFVAISPDLAGRFMGDHPLNDPTLGALDSLPRADDASAVRFLHARDSVTVLVPREMKLGELVRLYHMDYKHVRDQIAKQLGVDRVPDEHILHKGLTLRITLIPPRTL